MKDRNNLGVTLFSGLDQMEKMAHIRIDSIETHRKEYNVYHIAVRTISTNHNLHLHNLHLHILHLHMTLRMVQDNSLSQEFFVWIL
jgi:hypothetical protein